MKTLKLFLVVLVVGLLFTSCADVVTVVEIAETNPHVYGFWGGTWHGMITGFSFIGSLFSDEIAVYAIANNGGWYDFGFVGGFSIMFQVLAQIIKLEYNI